MANLLERAFFGKETCLIFSLNKNNEVYFQFGKLTGKDSTGKDEWLWKKVKMNDAELGEIILVLDHKKPKTSFFHSFENNGTKTTTQIWIERMPNNNIILKVKEANRALNEGEQQVLLTLLRHAIIMMNMKL